MSSPRPQQDGPAAEPQSAGRSDRHWPPYQPQVIEPKWQSLWEQSGLYLASQSADRPKYYCLDFFPYPSGDGLHVGHVRNYVPTDVISRFKRMQGFTVLHPMGWDSFGEPTEQYAIATGVQPRVSTDRNTRNFKHQFKIIGTSYDWSREIELVPARILSLDPMVFHPHVPARPGLPGDQLAVVVPGLPDDPVE